MKFFSWLILILVTFSCENATPKVNKALYHWTSQLDVSDAMNIRIDSLGISKIYLRFFDVDWSDDANQPIPKAQLVVRNVLNDSIEIIPTIFLTNETFVKISKNKLESLISKMDREISKIKKRLPNPIHEIQFDCDWTKKTKSKYFKFLRLFKGRLPQIKISCTIRLHQIKYFERTGIPPVDKGILMYYNMSSVDKFETKNSIINNEIGKEYLDRLVDYPLELDLALPCFSWAVIFRDERLIRLVNDVIEPDLDRSNFRKVSKNQYKVLKSTFLYGTYLYEDDLVKLETVSPSDLLQSAQLLKNKFSNDSRTISLYHMDSKVFNRYEIKFLQKVYHIFSDSY